MGILFTVVYKVLFLIVPLTLLVLGGMLIFQAYHLAQVVSSTPELVPVAMSFVPTAPYKVKAFVPSVIRPEAPQLSIEVQVELTGTTTPEFEAIGTSVNSLCDYVRVSPSVGRLEFRQGSPNSQTITSSLDIRTVTPPADCAFAILLESGASQASLNQTIPVDSISGTLYGAGRLVFGIILAIVGLLGSIKALFV